MSPPKSTKPRAPASSPLDVSKKLRIIRGPKSFGALLISEGQVDHRNEYEQLSRRFCTQFPPLVAAKRKPASAKKSEETPSRSLIKVPQWSVLPPSPQQQEPEASTDPPPPTDNSNDLDQIIYDDGKFFLKDSNSLPVELSTESVAERLMTCSASQSGRSFPSARQRPQTYIRYPLHKVACNTTRAFGKDNIFFHVRLEDYVFLLELNQWISKTFRQAVLSWPTLRWLLTQLTQPRNFPSHATESSDVEAPFSEVPVAGADSSFVTGESNGALGEDRRCSLIPSLPAVFGSGGSGAAGSGAAGLGREALTPSPHSGTYLAGKAWAAPASSTSKPPASRLEDISDEAVPAALSRMPPGTLRRYQRQMGWFVTDELFVYLINMMELSTGTKEPISFEAAFTEAHDRLGELAPHPKVVRHIYDYWRTRRTALGKPLVREFWGVPAATDNSPFAVFRARTKEKMVLRRPRRNAQDSGTRLQRHYEEFAKTDRLFQAVCQRDLIKLQMCDIDAILFEQLWRGREDPSYAHPVWPSLKRRLGIQLDVEEKRPRADVLKVSSNLEGFGDLADERSSAPSHSHHSSKRRRMDEPVNAISEMSRYQISVGRRTVHRPHRTERVPPNVSGPAASDAISAPDDDRAFRRAYVSPISLAPLFLNLRADCSKAELHAALEANGVVNMAPVGYLHRSVDASDAERGRNLHVNFSLAAPPPGAGDLLLSPIAGLPVPISNPSVTVPPTPLVINGVDLSRCPVYHQSLRSLPAPVRHPSNLRLVVPFGPPPASVLSGKGGGLPPPGRLDGARYPPVRSWLRLGRHGRLWLDRQQLIVPTPYLLSPPPLPLTPEDEDEEIGACSPFAPALQSAGRRCLVQMRRQPLTPLGKQLRRLAAEGEADHLRSEGDVSILLPQQQTSVPGGGATTLSICNAAGGHFICEFGQVSRLLPGGYSESGFYSGGAGGPESALAATSRLDLEPGFVGALGVDDPRNAGGFGLFCYARHMWQRPELWKDLVNRSPSV